VNTLRKKVKVRALGTPSALTGERTLSVTIPREWAHILNLSSGMEIMLELDLDSRVIRIMPTTAGETP
jgi:phosphate uptake regulator